MTKKAIGILGGTFDPIHFGHLRLGVEFYSSLNLSKIHIIPCFKPVHRDKPIASPSARLEMIKCAVQNDPTFFVDDREIRRGGASYTIETLSELRAENPKIPIFLLIGIDSFLNFMSWHQYQSILEIAHLAVGHRPNYHLPTSGEIINLIKKHEPNDINDVNQTAGKIFFQNITALDISSSDIRRQFLEKKNPNYLLPETVYQYLLREKLYQN